VNLERLITFFGSNPSARLLRSPHAAYIVDFLYGHFKREGNLATPHTVLHQRLTEYLDRIHETQPDVLRERADAYLNDWSTGETRWLRRYFDAQHAESVYQLTPHTEDVLTFLADLLDRDLAFIGTESRLSRIIATLSDITVRGSDDPERRLAHLRAERERIDEEIRSIEAGGAVATHSPTAIRERFADVVSDLVSLQGDFRAVEDSFKEITRDVLKRQAESVDSRGNILGFALEAEDQLKQQDQGASFQAFVRLILSQSQQDQLERLIAQLDEITELAEQVEGKQRLRGMIGSLSAEAEKVLQVTRRLNSTLRRLLDSRATSTRLRLSEVLYDIRTLAIRQAEDPPEVGIDVLADLDLVNVHQRTFWESPLQFDALELSDDDHPEDERVLAFKHLAEMRRLDWDRLRANIAGIVAQSPRTALPELLRAHPATGGTIEVLGYIQVAHDDGHEVDPSAWEVVYVSDGEGHEGPRPYEVPRVTFLAARLRQLGGALGVGGRDDG
jgi:hypothetical protein